MISALRNPTVILSVALMAVIAMMILPMPAAVLDLGLAISFGLAILIFTTTLFIERPLDFSSFPTIILTSLMLRLSLNVSSTKLIIGEGHKGTAAAGNVIKGFAEFVMGGNFVLGLVTFGVILIVNFLVITKGATRMAEVGARFALDGMPGRQMAIDADLSAGAIDHVEARRRRELEQAETTFFGSLDGASKFVKGDAAAGLFITALNLIVGVLVGTIAHGMPLGDAFHTYAVLTVGDGLVGQIPAVIISIGAALLLAKGGNRGAVDLSLFRQLGGNAGALGTVGVLMGFFAFVPGLPFVPFFLGALLLGYLAWRTSREPAPEEAALAETAPPPPPASIGDMLSIDDIHVRFAPDLVPMILDPTTGLEKRIENIRSFVISEFGVVLPEMRLTDDAALATNSYAIDIQGAEFSRGILRDGRILLLHNGDTGGLPSGEDVMEPVYGAPARWVSARHAGDAALGTLTTATPTEVLATHLLEVVKRALPRLVTLRTMRDLVSQFTSLTDEKKNSANRALFDELVPDKVPLDLLLGVVRLLLSDLVSVRNLPLVLEAVAEGKTIYSDLESITEHVRQRLGFQITSGLKRADGAIPLLQLAQDWENLLREYSGGHSQGAALPANEVDRLASKVSEAVGRCSEGGEYPALITSARQRRFVQSILQAKGIGNAVLSYEELGNASRPAILGVVGR